MESKARFYTASGKAKKVRPAWKGKRKAKPMPNLCVHCGEQLMDWEYRQNAYYHAACIIQIKRQRL